MSKDGTPTDGGPDIDRLERAVARLVERWSAVPDGPALFVGSGGEWSVARCLAHVGEYLPFWANAAADVAARSENDRAFGRTHDDLDRIAWVEDHAKDSTAALVDAIRTGMDLALGQIRAIPPDRFQRTGRHANRGEMTVTRIIDEFMVDHTESHAQQAEIAYARAIGAPDPD